MSRQDTKGHKKTFDIIFLMGYASGMREKNVRWEDDDFQAIEKAARKEGIDLSNYIRRCTIQYTREHHPETFEKDAS